MIILRRSMAFLIHQRPAINQTSRSGRGSVKQNQGHYILHTAEVYIYENFMPICTSAQRARQPEEVALCFHQSNYIGGTDDCFFTPRTNRPL
jgi:hypothetical protein